MGMMTKTKNDMIRRMKGEKRGRLRRERRRE
jgi:hypothetical protein